MSIDRWNSAKVLALGAVALGAVMTGTFAARAGQVSNASLGTGSVDATATQTDFVVRAVLAEVRALPCTASSEDLEAAIVYRLSQDGATRAIAPGAIDRLGRAKLCHTNYAAALAQVRLALLGRRLQRGTAALSGGGGRLGESPFSAPVVNIGGGTSNYSN